MSLSMSPENQQRLTRLIGELAELVLSEAGGLLAWDGTLNINGKLIAKFGCAVAFGEAERAAVLRGGQDALMVRRGVAMGAGAGAN